MPGQKPSGSAGQSSGAPTAAVRDGGRPSLPAKEARTDLGGVALLSDLASGDYSVTVLPPTSYVAARTPTRVRVNARGQAATTVRLTRGGVVTGRILDENGGPVTGASVSVLRLSRAGGRPQTGNYTTQPTNDLGVYRVWNLAPGDYVVRARFENSQSLSSDGPAVDGYQPTYFPGSLAFDGAGPVPVKAGQETGAVDIQFDPWTPRLCIGEGHTCERRARCTAPAQCDGRAHSSQLRFGLLARHCHQARRLPSW